MLKGSQRILRNLAGAVTLLAAVFCTLPAAAESSSAEYEVKTALVYNFARFTEWPSEAFDNDDQPLRLVVVGDRELLEAFTALEGKQAAGRRIHVERLEHPEQAVGCHLLFLARTEREQWPAVRAALTNSTTLMIGEMNGFLESGGTMNLHRENSKIRFQVNTANMRDHGVKISSRILKLATRIIDEG